MTLVSIVLTVALVERRSTGVTEVVVRVYMHMGRWTDRHSIGRFNRGPNEEQAPFGARPLHAIRSKCFTRRCFTLACRLQACAGSTAWGPHHRNRTSKRKATHPTVEEDSRGGWPQPTRRRRRVLQLQLRPPWLLVDGPGSGRPLNPIDPWIEAVWGLNSGSGARSKLYPRRFEGLAAMNVRRSITSLNNQPRRGAQAPLVDHW